MGRSKIREHIFKLLFMSQFNETEEMPQQLALYFEELEELSEEDRIYMEGKYEQVIAHLDEIDALLNENLKRMEDQPHGTGRFDCSETVCLRDEI